VNLREEMAEDWRRLNNEGLHNLYAFPNIIRVVKSRGMRWVEHVAHMGKTKAYKMLVGKPEGKRSLGRPRCRWEDNIRMARRKVECVKSAFTCSSSSNRVPIRNKIRVRVICQSEDSRHLLVASTVPF
jgi:hypothetical protein